MKNVTKKNMALKDFYEQVLVGVDPRERCATLLLLESLHVWRGDATENCPVLDVTHAAVLASVLLNVMDKQRASLVGKYDYRAYVAYVAADAGIGKTNTIIPTLNGIIPVSKMCAQREGEACVLTELTSILTDPFVGEALMADCPDANESIVESIKRLLPMPASAATYATYAR